MTKEEFDKLPIGAKVNYAYFKGVTYMGPAPGYVRDHVTMKDGNGTTKDVYKSLFIKNATIEATQ